MLASTRSNTLWGGSLLAALGAAYCYWTAIAPATVPCVSTGCTLYRDMSVFGISLWWYGAGAFTLLALFCLAGKQPAARGLAWLMLAADTALLLLMAFTAPCAACLVTALFIAGAFLAIPANGRRTRQQRLPVLFLFWGGLFISNAVFFATERAGAWTMHGPDNAPVTLYFSPSCQACREAIASLAQAAPGTVAYRPVAENDDDILSIAAMRREVEGGASVAEALRKALAQSAPAAPSTLEQLRLRWRLLRNKALVLSAGADRLPLLLVSGMPRMPYHAAPAATAVQPTSGPASPVPGQSARPMPSPLPGQDGALPFSTDDFAGCAQTPTRNATCD